MPLSAVRSRKRFFAFHDVFVYSHHALLPDLLAEHFMNTLRKIRRLHLRDGLPVREISRRTGLSRREVRASLEMDNVPRQVTALQAPSRSRIEARRARFAIPQQSWPVQPQALDLERNLRNVFDIWRATEGVFRGRGTVRAKEQALRVFEACFPDQIIGEITRAQGQKFKAYLYSLSCSSMTKQHHLTRVKELLNFAYDKLELIPRSPWVGICVSARMENARHPWTRTELHALFGLPLFTKYELPAGTEGGADAAYWLPLLGLFTGARLGELCQLHTSDIFDLDGVWVLELNEKEGKRLKSPASARRIPVHSKLIKLGFLDYANVKRDAGHASLWPTLNVNVDSSSQGFSVWFGKFKRRAIPHMGLPDFHSFRHSVRTKMDKAGISARVQDAITGHKPAGSFGTMTYSHPDIDDLVDAIEAISYKGLLLRKVYRVVNRIGLRAWANATFEQPPCRTTLGRWVHAGLISPKPVRIGKYFFVLPTAVCSRKRSD